MVVGGDPLAFSSLLYLVPELKGLEGSKSWQQLGLSLVYLTHGLPMGPGLPHTCTASPNMAARGSECERST